MRARGDELYRPTRSASSCSTQRGTGYGGVHTMRRSREGLSLSPVSAVELHVTPNRNSLFVGTEPSQSVDEPTQLLLVFNPTSFLLRTPPSCCACLDWNTPSTSYLLDKVYGEDYYPTCSDPPPTPSSSIQPPSSVARRLLRACPDWNTPRTYKLQDKVSLRGGLGHCMKDDLLRRSSTKKTLEFVSIRLCFWGPL